MKQKITLIVPVYNEGPFIDRCIDSIRENPNYKEVRK